MFYERFIIYTICRNDSNSITQDIFTPEARNFLPKLTLLYLALALS